MSKKEELKDQELENAVGGAKTQQSGQAGELELEEFEPGSGGGSPPLQADPGRDI